ncbi:MAG: LysM peptidoglycan-binding domain-containing protein [Bacteroidetes bacterium]|nr:LysM peptidoglycan-binding domain-containing protein [Bacteroidota bacterium]MCH8523932.1 LysM peptidoglycan-binding domain-containing protein [Balneolales bacterium]
MHTVQKLLGIAVFCLFLVIPQITHAQSEQRRTHTVEAGETLFRISRMYDVSIENLRGWNNLSGNQINVGQRLFVSPPPGTVTQRPPSAGEGVQSAPREGGRVEHRVRAGETLFSISRRYGVSVDEVRQWNNLRSNLIEVGQVLEIRESAQNVVEQPITRPVITDTIEAIPRDDMVLSKDEPEGEAIRSAPVSSAYYVVRSGDTVSGIAQRHGITASELRELNQLRSDRLAIGQVLLVRRPQGLPSIADSAEGTTAQGRFSIYEVRRGDRLNSVLSRFSMTEMELVALNPDIDVTELRQGQQITVLLPPDITYRNPYRVHTEIQPESTESAEEMRIIRYADTDRGRSTTSGDLYNPTAYTAAHNRLPLGSVVFVQHHEADKGIFVLINDRMVDSGLKLSHAAFEALGFEQNRMNNAVVVASER